MFLSPDSRNSAALLPPSCRPPTGTGWNWNGRVTGTLKVGPTTVRVLIMGDQLWDPVRTRTIPSQTRANPPCGGKRGIVTSDHHGATTELPSPGPTECTTSTIKGTALLHRKGGGGGLLRWRGVMEGCYGGVLWRGVMEGCYGGLVGKIEVTFRKLLGC